jgi:hypothetical protein
VYALWEHDELIYYGRALGAGAIIHSSLRWEITSKPRTREAELLREFEGAHGRLPRCNAKAA